MDVYFTILLIVGITSLLVSFLPILIKKFKISFTIPLLIFGALLFYINAPLPWPNPVWEIDLTLRYSELVVIISLMVAGLKIGLNYSLKEWRNPIRLLSITMPLFMLAVFLLSYYLLDFNGPISLLLAAVLAPTDPALATEVQLNKKQTAEEKNLGVQYNLTAEAGLNDGLAFPFVYLAIIWSKNNGLDFDEWKEWISYYVIYKVIMGVLVGTAIGFLYSYIIKKLLDNKERKIHQVFVALSLTLISYALAELVSSYGFLSVFFTGLFAHYHKHMNNDTMKSDSSLDFLENTEKILIVFWMIFFGGSIIAGILKFNTVSSVIFSLCLVLIVRPLLGYIALYKTNLGLKNKWAIAFFGIRGIGSVFYLTYAFKYGNFESVDYLFSIVALVILLSIVLHGTSIKRTISTIKKTDD